MASDPKHQPSPDWASHSESDHGQWLSSVVADLPPIETWERDYNKTVDGAITDIRGSEAWAKIGQALTYAANTYRTGEGFTIPLLVERPALKKKPFSSALNKAFRLNRLHQHAEPPVADLVHPGNWYEKLDDCVRSTVVVSMLDGVSVCFDSVQDHVAEVISYADYKSKERGYYAAHLRLDHDNCTVFHDGTYSQGKIGVEIQIKTHLHYALGQLTHGDYETQRIDSDAVSDNWAWDPTAAVFDRRMLGHVVQYLDGAILKLRRTGNGSKE